MVPAGLWVSSLCNLYLIHAVALARVMANYELRNRFNGNHIVDSPRSNLDNAEGVRNFSPGLRASARYPGKWHNRPRCNPEGVAERRARANSFRVYANSWLLVPRALPWARISERLSALITLSDFSGESTT